MAGPAPCARCKAQLDAKCRHALLCGSGPATRGHNRVRDTLLGLASLSDGAAASEVRGLIGSAPRLRPADVLTTAAFGRLVALDVGIANPAARTAGEDACASMVSQKTSEYARFLSELAEDGIEYRPMVWSCWGRPHADAAGAVRSMAQAAARRQGAISARCIERRTCSAIGVQIWKRAARMAATCRPSVGGDEAAAILPDAIAGALARLGRPADSGGGGSSGRSSSRGSTCSSRGSLEDAHGAAVPSDPSRLLHPCGASSLASHPPGLPSSSSLASGALREVAAPASGAALVAGSAAGSLAAAAADEDWATVTAAGGAAAGGRSTADG